MKTMLLPFVLAGGSLILLASCASDDPTSSGLPEAAQREDARKYGEPARLSADPASPWHEVRASKGQVSTKLAEF